MGWTIDTARELCMRIEATCPTFGCHVALTGGVLYKEGERKDLDLLFYRIRQVDEIDVDGLFDALGRIGMRRITDGKAWCIKARYDGRSIDCFFPDLSGDYPPKSASGPGVDALFADEKEVPHG